MSATAEQGTRPYPGMRPFDPEEAGLFHGQESHISALLQRLGSARLIAVFGESGCGKSSIVRAGLIPRLLGTFRDPELALWRVAISRPARTPIRQLAEALARTVSRDDAEVIDRQLRASSYGLLDVVRQADLPKGRRVLVVVDQFEELFRFARERAGHVESQDEAALFVKLLLAATESSAVAAAGSPVYVVLTMRSEYLGECARFFGLAEAVNDGAYLLPKMTRANLEAAIVGPLEQFGAEIDNSLLQYLLNETEAAQQDGLPLLQHALRRIWDAAVTRDRTRVRLTMADFDKVSASKRSTAALLLERHLDAHLDEIWTGLGPRQQALCVALFKQLGEYDTRFRLIRRPADIQTVARVCQGSTEEVLAIVDAFRDESRGRTFLMPPAERTAALLEGLEPLDISHEALLRRWARLRDWIDQERKDAEEFQNLADRANRHSPLTGGELSRTLSWNSRMKPTEAWSQRYLGWDIEARRPRYHFADAMQHLERCRRRSWMMWVGLSATALIVTAAVGVAMVTWRDSTQQRQHQEALEFEQGQLRVALEAQRVATEEKGRAERLLTTERDELKRTNARLDEARSALESRNAQLTRSQAELQLQVDKTTEATRLAEERLAESEAQKQIATDLNRSLRITNEQLDAERRLAAAADRRRIAEQQFTLWANRLTPDDPFAVARDLQAIVAETRAYAQDSGGDISAGAVASVQRAAAATFLAGSADVPLRAPVLLAMPAVGTPAGVVAIRQGASATGAMAADPAGWTIQRASSIPQAGWIVGGQGGFAGLRERPNGSASLRKFHPFAVSGLGMSTDGEWVASASAGGDMRLVRRTAMVSGSKFTGAVSRFLNTGKLLTFMILQRYKGDYAVREFAIRVAAHEGRRSERRDVTVVGLTETDRLLIWRQPGPIGKQIRGVDQIEVGGRYSAIVTDPSTQDVWAARVQPVQGGPAALSQRTEFGVLSTGKETAAFSPCGNVSDLRSVTDMAWDEFGERLAIGFQDGAVRVLARAAGSACRFDTDFDLPAHGASVTTVSWHGHVLATGAHDGSARTWNVRLDESDRNLLTALRRLGRGREETAGALAVIERRLQAPTGLRAGADR